MTPPFSLTIADVGPFTQGAVAALATRRPHLGARPYGARLCPLGQRPLLLAGGCGTAPWRLLAQRLRAQGTPVPSLVGARSADCA
jgi:NAD(P)H-flavin reductase